ncbi:MAG: TetR/AcrR family transcriptional regulator [Actinomycetota bacterium]|nr:TetR/AcrR family transcriptional regulator [Actinomycetota bacterium]
MATQTGGAPQRLPVTKERVLATAVALADQGGLESLSMRKIAKELGVVPMALYRHVSNKEEMLDGMVDIVFSEIELPSNWAGWRTAMRKRAISARQVLSRHPWATALMESRAQPGPANLSHHDSVMGGLRKAGFSVEMAVHAYNALDSYIYGFALQETSLPFGNSEELAEVAEIILRGLPADEYPYLREVVIQSMESGFDYAGEFEFGLDLILDGLERVQGAADGGVDAAS